MSSSPLGKIKKCDYIILRRIYNIFVLFKAFYMNLAPNF